MILNELNQHKELIEKVIETLIPEIEKGCELIKSTIQNGNKIFLVGNGGSAADAQHIAAEFTGRYVKERKPLPAIALTTDTSALTAIANDYGYDYVFSRQLDALASSGDVLIAISTSGMSGNIINATIKAQSKGCKVIGLLGKSCGLIGKSCDVSIKVPSETTARIQEIHILIGHVFCKSVDDLF